MHEPERRGAERATLQDFTYINLGGDNGGSVLNLSAGGLCFNSITPIQRNGPVRFWFSDLKRRVDAEGEVVWLDQTRKTGGLRFAALPAEARERILQWNAPAARIASAQKESVFPTPPRAAFGKAAPAVNNAAPAEPEQLAEPAARARGSELAQVAPGGGFARGLVTGLLVSAAFGSVLLFHAYRREIGELLIRVGEHVATKSQAEPQVAPASPSGSPSAERSAAVALPASVPPAAKAQEQPVPALEKVQPPEPAPEPIVVARGPGKVRTAPANTPDPPHPPEVLAYPAAVPGNVLTNKAMLPQLQPTAPPQAVAAVANEESAGASTGPPPQMYFEVGKFKNPLGAHETTNRIAQIGLPASVQQKGHLFNSSYVVLVGPYNNEAAAEAAHKTLVQSDFNAQPFERGSRTIEFRAGVRINGASTAGGDCEIRWESYVTEATVKFLQRGAVVATATGKWAPSAVKYPRDAIVIQRNPDGSRKLLEVRFAGMKRVLVLGKPS
jgi:hypothetical protein